MGQTITEKIIAAHAGRAAVQPGDTVLVRPDRIIMSERTGFIAMRSLQQMCVARLEDPTRNIIVLDHSTQAAATEAPVAWGNRQLRVWAAEQGVDNFYDAGKGGLRHQVVVEQGHVGPGMLCVTDEPNLDNMGAIGALAVMVGKDVWEPMATGDVEVTVPESLRIWLTGALRTGVTASDLGQRIRHDVGGWGGVGQLVEYRVIRKIAEFDGPGVAWMTIDERMDLLAMYPVGMGVMNPDDRALEWVRDHAGPAGTPVRSDPDAHFEASFEYDLSTLEPYITPPPSVRNGMPLADLPADIRIQQAVVGSCANGRLDDLRKVAEVLRGRKVHRTVKMFISPITQHVYAQAAREGLLEVFAEAGAIVATPGCGTCWGYIGQLTDGETCISTTQHNYPGRMGSASAAIYLASPYTVAASAVEGRIVDPRAYLPVRAAALASA